MLNSLAQRKKDILYFCFSFFIILSFIFGFIKQENSAGGGNLQELHHHWENYKIFLNNSFFEAVNLTKGGADNFGMTYDSSRSPLLSMLQAYVIFNFETDNLFDPKKLLYFKLLSFLISLLCFIIFFIVLKKKFTENSSFELFFLTSSILLLSPYFRTSAFWGFGENYTFLTFLLSFFFIIKFKNYIKLKFEKLLVLNLLAISFFSSLVVYFDVKAVIIPLICYFIVLFSKTNIKNKYLITIFYFIFSLPFLYLIILWGSIIPPGPSEVRQFGKIFLIENVGYTVSIIAFYILPFIFFKYESFYELKKKIFNKHFLFLIFLSLIYLIIFSQTNNIANEMNLGKGFLHKLSNLLFSNIKMKIAFLNFSFLISFFILFFYLENIADYLIIFFFIFSSIFTTWLFQEYFDPLIYLLILTFFSSKIKIKNYNLMLIFIYQSLFLFSSIIYYI